MCHNNFFTHHITRKFTIIMIFFDTIFINSINLTIITKDSIIPKYDVRTIW